MLTHRQQKVAMEDYDNGRKCYDIIISANGKVDSMLPSMVCQLITKKHVLKEEACCLMQILTKRSKRKIMWRKSVTKSKIKSQLLNLSRSENLQIYQMMLCALLIGLL